MHPASRQYSISPILILIIQEYVSLSCVHSSLTFKGNALLAHRLEACSSVTQTTSTFGLELCNSSTCPASVFYLSHSQILVSNSPILRQLPPSVFGMHVSSPASIPNSPSYNTLHKYKCIVCSTASLFYSRRPPDWV